MSESMEMMAAAPERLHSQDARVSRDERPRRIFSGSRAGSAKPR